MLEKLIENWLVNTTERSYQQPFCYMLAKRGYTLIHSTRHSAMELGKDVIAADPDGTICAYQLKTAPASGRLRLSMWKKENLGEQLWELATLPVEHPALGEVDQHKSFFVINGYLDEEVSEVLNKLNRSLRSRGFGPVKVINIGHMITWAKDCGDELWPSEAVKTKQFHSTFVSKRSDPKKYTNETPRMRVLFTFDDTKQIDSYVGREILRKINSQIVVTRSN